MKKIYIERLSIKILNGSFGHLAKAPSAKIAESQMGASNIFLAIDTETKEEFKVQLISMVRLQQTLIPEIFSYTSENMSPEECRIPVLRRSKVQHVDELCFYLYQRVDG